MSTIYEMHAEICRMFSNPRRLEIIDHLRDGEMTVGQLVELTGLTQPALSQHLSLMWHYGVLARRKEGVNVYYALSDPKIAQAFDIFRKILMERLESTERLVEEIRESSA
jgi:ArsR family transcriptional regulator